MLVFASRVFAYDVAPGNTIPKGTAISIASAIQVDVMASKIKFHVCNSKTSILGILAILGFIETKIDVVLELTCIDLCPMEEVHNICR